MLSPAAGGLITRFSTDAMPVKKYRELMTQHVVGLDHQPLAEDYWGSATAMALPNLGIVTSAMKPIMIRRTPQLLSDGNDNRD